MRLKCWRETAQQPEEAPAYVSLLDDEGESAQKQTLGKGHAVADAYWRSGPTLYGQQNGKGFAKKNSDQVNQSRMIVGPVLTV